MKSERRIRGLRLLFIAVAIALLFPLTFMVLETIYGGRHLVSKGESHGFTIGMTKREVLERYKALEKSVNLRTLRIDSESDGVGILALEASELVLTLKWEAGDHWLGYRSEYPCGSRNIFSQAGC